MYEKRPFVDVTAITRLVMSYFKISIVTLLILDYILFNRARHLTTAKSQNINELLILDNGNFILHIANKHANGGTTLILSENDAKANHDFSAGPLTNVTLGYYSDAYPSVVVRNLIPCLLSLLESDILEHRHEKYGTFLSITERKLVSLLLVISRIGNL